MIRYSEVVLPGHPDKLCDAVAEAIVSAALATDPDAYVRVEVSVWQYEMWLTGFVTTRTPVPIAFAEIAKDTVIGLGYRPPNAYDGSKLNVRCSIRVQIADPRPSSHRVSDQCVAIGWAGYDEGVDFLPPEHFLARRLASALVSSFADGLLRDQGPDGKLLVRLREEQNRWIVEHVLASVQQLDSTAFREFVPLVLSVLEGEYRALRASNARWTRSWDEIEATVNPNGKWVEGGPLSDNGQTGRKLVMDFYGPRVPIGGGALYGKDPLRIDRVANSVCRAAAKHAVRTGASECLVRATYAPSVATPLDVAYEMHGQGEPLAIERFDPCLWSRP